MNCDLISTVITNSVVIILFLISYYLIDSRAIKRERNKRKVGERLLIACAEECKKNIELLDESETLEKYIIPKVNFSIAPKRDPIIGGILQVPFANESTILSFFESGALDDKNLQSFLELKRKHSDYIQMKIILFDAEPPTSLQIEHMKRELEQSIERVIRENRIEGDT